MRAERALCFTALSAIVGRVGCVMAMPPASPLVSLCTRGLSMPFFDRFWWLRYAAIPGALLLLSFIIDMTFTDMHWSTQGEQLDLHLFIEALLILAWGLGILGIAIFWVKNAPMAHDRMIRRESAIEGNQDAIPLAQSSPTQAEFVDTTTLLSLLWRQTRLSRFFTLFFAITAIPPLIVMASVFPIIVIVGLVILLQGRVSEVFMGDWSIVVAVILIIVLAPIVSGMALYAIRMMVRSVVRMRQPQGVEATADGITVRPFSGAPASSLRWDEMRLLEVAYSKRSSSRVYTLYGSDRSISWYEDEQRGANAWYDPVDITTENSVDGYQQLLVLITARTGLLPRTFDPRLQQEPQADQTMLHQNGMLPEQE